MTKSSTLRQRRNTPPIERSPSSENSISRTLNYMNSSTPPPLVSSPPAYSHTTSSPSLFPNTVEVIAHHYSVAKEYNQRRRTTGEGDGREAAARLGFWVIIFI
ncbi:hypothetical protein Droror1_Dr00003471 [Drosera rotundifolia]